MPQGKLRGKVAIITGAAQGLGKAVAEKYIEEGARVIINDVREETQKVAEKIGAFFVKADVSNEDDVDLLVKTAADHFGAVHILVNNAGILRTSRIFSIDKEEWDLVLRVNLNGVFLCTKAVLPLMRDQKFGRIINISSSAGRSVSTLGGAHYTTSKAGVLGFTRAVAKEVGGYNITVNAICPGLIDTEMVRLECNPKQIADYEGSFPVPRLGTPAEIADLALFLAAGAGYITGASIDINGGDLMM